MAKSNYGSLLGLSLLLASMGNSMHVGDAYGTNDGSIGHGIPDVVPKVIPNGCKEYSFYGHTVIAINEKSARKKCKRLAGIKP